VSKHVLHEAKPGKILNLDGSSSFDIAGNPKIFQQDAVARLLGLGSTRKCFLSTNNERLMLDDE
jgi:hypothetical protein